MKFLSKRLHKAAHYHNIQGVQVAAEAPTLHIHFMQNLVVFAKANTQEVQELRKIFEQFAMSSGLTINPQKSAIWFSRPCGQRYKELVLREMKCKNRQGKRSVLEGPNKLE
jgi:hypothetical protein